MDNSVSKIAANANFLIQQNKAKEEKKEKQVEDQKPQSAGEKVESKSADAILDAMQLSAMQNKALVMGKSVNPKDYLSEDRIADIEASIGGFEKSVENAKTVMDTEFAGVSAYNNLPEAQKLALAAVVQGA